MLTLATRVRPGDSGCIDPGTTEASLTVTPYEDGRVHALVMSDESTYEGRTFDNGHDPKWTALNKGDYTNDALQLYASDHVTTINGMLNITVSATDTTFAQEPKRGSGGR
jgi:beta-glucanase (GH16 family)